MLKMLPFKICRFWLKPIKTPCKSGPESRFVKTTQTLFGNVVKTLLFLLFRSLVRRWLKHTYLEWRRWIRRWMQWCKSALTKRSRRLETWTSDSPTRTSQSLTWLGTPLCSECLSLSRRVFPSKVIAQYLYITYLNKNKLRTTWWGLLTKTIKIERRSD